MSPEEMAAGGGLEGEMPPAETGPPAVTPEDLAGKLDELKSSLDDLKNKIMELKVSSRLGDQMAKQTDMLQQVLDERGV